MNLNADVGKPSWKKILIVFVSLLVVGGLAFGGWVAYKKVSNRPLTPLESKQVVANYLEEKTGQKEFKCAIDVSKEKSAWDALKFAYDAPPDYKDVYRAMGEHLSVAETFLNSTEDKARFQGYRIVVELINVANDVAYDPWLGARVAEAYILANLDKVEETPKRGHGRELLMYLVVRAYRTAEEYDLVLDLGKKYLAQYNSGPRADEVRRRVVQVLQGKGQRQEAQVFLAQINKSAAEAKTERKSERDAKRQ